MLDEDAVRRVQVPRIAAPSLTGRADGDYAAVLYGEDRGAERNMGARALP
jgi:hypothetical protein